MSSTTYNLKKVEQSLLDGAIQGVILLAEWWTLKEIGIMRKSESVKAMAVVGTTALSEVIFDWADGKGWIPKL